MRETYVLHVTKKCNLNCLYCYEKDKTSEYTWEEIRDNIDNIMNSLPENSDFGIEFLGGEPLMRWDLVKSAYEYIENNYQYKSINPIMYTITTNGVLVNDEIADYIFKNTKINISISMDGTKYSNQLRFDKLYINSYDDVVKSIQLLQKYNIDASIHIVTHLVNVGFLFDNIKHIYEVLGVKHIGIGTVESTMIIDDRYMNIFKKQITMVARYNLDHQDLIIDLFQWLKPIEDVRTYVKDKETGKTVFESYGRIPGDITDKIEENKYEIIKSTGHGRPSEIINEIRSFAYNQYRNMRQNNDTNHIIKIGEMLIKEVDEEEYMGYLANSDSVNREFTDCVGKQGECEIVTDPQTNQTRCNTHEVKNKIFQNLNTPDSKHECQCNPNENSQELDSKFKILVASTFIDIIENQKRLEDKLDLILAANAIPS